jgi:hypothetical protein
MAFVSGPRQVGKTTLAQIIQKNFSQSYYFNWDDFQDQKNLIQNPYFFTDFNRTLNEPFLIIFDEVHKYAKWKNYLKGAFDKYHQDFSFLITGSGRLDIFQKGGDSLFGRYFQIPIFPLSLGELNGKYVSFTEFKNLTSNLPEANSSTTENYQNLMEFSGFPEPFLKAKKDFYNIWEQKRKNY